MSNRGWVAGSVLALGLAASVMAYRGFRATEHAEQRAMTVAAQAEVHRADPGANVERLRSQVALMQGQLASLSERTADEKAPPPEAAPPPVEELDPAELRERREADSRRWKEHMAEVAASFEQETLDRSFATTAKESVDKAISANPAIQATARKVDCRSRTCRVEIGDAKSATVEKQIPLLLNSLVRTLPRAQADYRDEENGQKTIVLYLTNEEPVAHAPPR